MKIKTSVIKHLICALVMFAAMFVQADVASPSPRTMSHAEWTAQQTALTMQYRDALMTQSASPISENIFLLQLAIPWTVLMVFIFVLVVSVRRKHPSYLVWLAFCAVGVGLFFNSSLASTYFFDRFDNRYQDARRFANYSIIFLIAASCLLASYFFFLKKKFIEGIITLVLLSAGSVGFFLVMRWKFDKPTSMSTITDFERRSTHAYDYVIEPEMGEPYDEYLIRANRITNRIINHHCKKCDKPMNNYWRDYWRCSDCDKGEMTCSKCGGQKIPKGCGRYRQEGFEWKCPICDKDDITCSNCGAEKIRLGISRGVSEWICPYCANDRQ